MPRYKLHIEYDGTPYYGWQRQDGLPSVQQALEEIFTKFTGEKVKIFAAGRTDKGVHALAQICHIDLERAWSAFKICEAANGHLIKNACGIAVISCEITQEDFDARFSATGRHYRYIIENRRAPLTFNRNRAWLIKKPLDAQAMHKAAQILVGYYDFTTFRSVNCQAHSPVKSLRQLDVTRYNSRIEIVAHSRSFLHNQVRSMVGSLKLVGEGKWQCSDLERARDALDRKACGPVAPACGLYLEKVDYL